MVRVLKQELNFPVTITDLLEYFAISVISEKGKYNVLKSFFTKIVLFLINLAGGETNSVKYDNIGTF